MGGVDIVAPLAANAGRALALPGLLALVREPARATLMLVEFEGNSPRVVSPGTSLAGATANTGAVRGTLVVDLGLAPLVSQDPAELTAGQRNAVVRIDLVHRTGWASAVPPDGAAFRPMGDRLRAESGDRDWAVPVTRTYEDLANQAAPTFGVQFTGEPIARTDDARGLGRDGAPLEARSLAGKEDRRSELAAAMV